MGRRRVWWIGLAVVAAALYALLWLAYVRQWSWQGAVDSALLRPLYDYGIKHPAWVRFWDLTCDLLGPDGLRLAGAATVVFAVVRRNLRVVLFVLVTIGLGGIVTETAKHLVERPRPGTALVNVASTSFPSGHAVAVMGGVLVLLTVWSGMFGRRGRIASVALGAVVVIVVGVGRVVLNVHNPTDVIAGWALGYLWFLLCLYVIRPLPLAAAAAPDAEPIGEAAAETPEVRGSAR